jgi:dihydroxyacetone kinase-like predicted kinase
VSEREALLRLLRGAEAAIEAARERIDDLNVYPVPHGDTGTNLAVTVRSVREAVEASTAEDRTALAEETARAALMGARGTSGLILSQIVRGLALELASARELDAGALARALRAGSDAAHRAVRAPVEGTMLTLVRTLAEAAARADSEPLPVLLAHLVQRGEAAVERTQVQLDVLREAGVVDAGAAGLVELLRGVAAAVADEPLPAPAPVAPPSLQDGGAERLVGYRYCTTFVVEGESDAAVLEAEIEPLGDSVIVVGDETALKVHVHTDDPGAALTAATRRARIDNVEIVDLHQQTQARGRRLALVPDTEPTSAE